MLFRPCSRGCGPSRPSRRSLLDLGEDEGAVRGGSRLGEGAVSAPVGHGTGTADCAEKTRGCPRAPRDRVAEDEVARAPHLRAAARLPDPPWTVRSRPCPVGCPRRAPCAPRSCSLCSRAAEVRPPLLPERPTRRTTLLTP